MAGWAWLTLVGPGGPAGWSACFPVRPGCRGVAPSGGWRRRRCRQAVGRIDFFPQVRIATDDGEPYVWYLTILADLSGWSRPSRSPPRGARPRSALEASCLSHSTRRSRNTLRSGPHPARRDPGRVRGLRLSRRRW
ncbi:hypothetical protein FRAHR75_240052 [Frankia sp. Hr75.2]|nr:hypothetical protein FRAHR75_240052 [Frankia sp. Hr75.2]